MDEQKKNTLELIVKYSHRLSMTEAGTQLILVAHDYLLDGDEARARNILCMVTDLYYESLIIQELQKSQALVTAIADLVKAFQVTDFRLLKGRGIIG